MDNTFGGFLLIKRFTLEEFKERKIHKKKFIDIVRIIMDYPQCFCQYYQI
jgi:hypothetical protein